MHSISQALTWPWMQDFVNTYGWIWPLCEIIHYTGMSLIIGIIVGLGILLDTFVVRTVIIPALFTLIGPRIWWPGLRAER